MTIRYEETYNVRSFTNDEINLLGHCGLSEDVGFAPVQFHFDST